MPILSDKQTIQSIFFGTWIVLFFVSMIIHFSASPNFKRKGFPILNIVGGFLFLIFVYLLDGGKNFYFSVIFVGLIMYLNIRCVKYCPKCGAYNGRIGNFFTPPNFCQQCGTALDQEPSKS
jgi:hypothetical protein